MGVGESFTLTLQREACTINTFVIIQFYAALVQIGHNSRAFGEEKVMNWRLKLQHSVPGVQPATTYGDIDPIKSSD